MKGFLLFVLTAAGLLDLYHQLQQKQAHSVIHRLKSLYSLVGKGCKHFLNQNLINVLGNAGSDT